MYDTSPDVSSPRWVDPLASYSKVVHVDPSSWCDIFRLSLMSYLVDSVTLGYRRPLDAAFVVFVNSTSFSNEPRLLGEARVVLAVYVLSLEGFRLV